MLDFRPAFLVFLLELSLFFAWINACRKKEGVGLGGFLGGVFTLIGVFYLSFGVYYRRN